jgi:CspA family cold shock protein
MCLDIPKNELVSGNSAIKTVTKGNVMTTGIISWLVKDRGFGFIKSSGGHELFFHRSQVRGVAFELLTQGQSTTFNVALGTKGFQAIDVRPTVADTTYGVGNSRVEKEIIFTVQKVSQTTNPESSLIRLGEPAKNKVAV